MKKSLLATNLNYIKNKNELRQKINNNELGILRGFGIGNCLWFLGTEPQGQLT